jgi:hypothetical protein
VSIMLFIMIEKYFNDDACLNGREKKRIDWAKRYNIGLNILSAEKNKEKSKKFCLSLFVLAAFTIPSVLKICKLSL